MKSRLSVLIGVWFVVGWLYAQQDDYEAFKREQAQKFGVFATNQQAKYDAYRRELNAEYARFMAESWEKMRAFPAVEIPSEKRVSPVVYEDTMVSSEFIFNYIPILFNSDVVEIPVPVPQAEPIAPIEAKAIEHEIVSVAFYGTLVSVPFPMDEVWRVDKISERELSKLWSRLSESRPVTPTNFLA